MNIHSERRWYWALAGADLLVSLGQALKVYETRHGQYPEVVWVNPATAEKLGTPAGIELAIDGYLPKVMAAMSLPMSVVIERPAPPAPEPKPRPVVHPDGFVQEVLL